MTEKQEPRYHKIPLEIQEQIRKDRQEHKENPYAFRDENVMRRNPNRDKASLWRPAFVRDVEKIMNIPYYNRYSDKTQVFSFYKNDDISRRAYHVQLVSRTARNIGRMLNLNEDLIEAISLGHDIGHTPFGHAGERLLNDKLREHTGRYFNHNVHSVRVLDQLVGWNISLQTLDGVLCHNGELELKEYRPRPLDSFDELDARVEACYVNCDSIKKLVPSTLEACVMRVCDIIAYLGKDRQDAVRLGMLEDESPFSNDTIGHSNSQIINNMIVNIIQNSYGKPYLQMDEEYFEAFRKAKKENYELIYRHDSMETMFQEQVAPMFDAVYEAILKQAKEKKEDSVFYQHHILFLQNINQYNPEFSIEAYLETEPNQLAVDFIASMTDDYFIDLYEELFPKGPYSIQYRGYFEK
ncbi:MAG: HD domain-containing protein [Lachnospiraceae bacterium]|nr:HD domain-containing protein [Lachnospiraceae bacterium]